MATPERLGVTRRLGFSPGSTIRWAAAAWLLCAATLWTCRALVGQDVALVLHAAVVPPAFFAATLLAWNNDRHLGCAATTVVCPLLVLAVVAGLDLVLFQRVAGLRPVVLDTALGTWVPLLLVLGSTAAAARLLCCSGRGRRRFLAWTATPLEQRSALPGDTLLDDGAEATHAITIRAPAAAVWAVVARLGSGPEGFRTFDADRAPGGPPRAAPPLAPGDRLPFAGHGAVWFEVLDVLCGRHLVLGCHLAARPVHGLSWAARSPRDFQRATWSFALREAGAETRLLARVRVQACPRGRWTGWGALFPLAHLLVERLQLLEIRRCAEATLPAPATA
jgi:hypothetical protein